MTIFRMAAGRGVVLAALLAVLLTVTAVVASAADVGPLLSRLFSANAPVTYPVSERAVSAVTLTTGGAQSTISAATITVTGSALGDLAGQSVDLVLLDASNVQVQSVTAVLSTSTNLTIGTAMAAVSLAVPGSPAASSVTGWAVFIAGQQAIGPASTSALKTVTLGNGTFAVVVTAWQNLLVTAGSTTTDVRAIVLTTATPGVQCVTITLSATGPGNNPKAWALDFDFGAGPFWGTPPSSIQTAVIQSTTGTIYHLVGTGTGSGAYDQVTNNAVIRSSQSLDILICQNNAAAAPNRAEAYTTSAQVRYGTWDSGTACVARTVTGNGTYPFYFGWQVSIDLTDAYAYLRTFDAGAPRSFGPSPDTVTPALSGATTGYTVKNTRDTAIKGTDSYVVVLCANSN